MAASSTSFRKGQRPPVGAGRPRGAPNAVTLEMRQAFTLLLERNTGNLDPWLGEVAHGDPARGIKADPGRALDIICKMAEFVTPKLARADMAVSGVGITVNLIGSDANLV